jgi:4-amino-4-deoxy-L-arabinose transferase-like glycosyltransferase
VARLLPFLFGMEHYGDAPVRIEIAERWARQPHLWRGFSETYQFGPLHLTLLGGAIRLLHDRVLAARLLSLAAGLCAVWLLWRIAERLRGPEAAFLAALGLALSPLHIQASTTGASEALFLALLLAAIDLALLDRAAPAAVLLGAAGLIRYDGWLYVPLLGALLFLRRRDLLRAAGFCALAAAPALWWMWRTWVYDGDPLFTIHYIDREHRRLAEMMLGWFGQVRWRLYALFYWPIAVCGIATPVLGAFSMWGSFKALRRREAGWELVALAWLPVALFTFRAAVLTDFRPLSRFAMVAAVLSLPFAHAALSAWGRRAAIAVLVITPLAFAAVSWRRDGALAEWARPLSPISSVPPGIADAADWLRHNARPEDTILLDTVWHYLDIPLAFAAGLPDEQWIRARWEDMDQRLARRTPTLAVLIYQGKLGDWTKDTFEFRSLRFCRQVRFTYATIYRRCD